MIFVEAKGRPHNFPLSDGSVAIISASGTLEIPDKLAKSESLVEALNKGLILAVPKPINKKLSPVITDKGEDSK